MRTSPAAQRRGIIKQNEVATADKKSWCFGGCIMQRFSKLSVLVTLWCFLPVMARGEESGDRQVAIKTAVEKAIGYLQDRGETWKDSRQCAACHHVPLMTWAMHEAKRHAIEIDDELLKSCTDWFFAEGDPAKIFQRNSQEEEEYNNPLSAMSVYALLTETNDPNEPNFRAITKRIMQGIADAQEADGSWKPFFGRAPIFGSRESLALWLTDVTSWPNQPDELRAIIAEPRQKAIAWLKAHSDDIESHVLAMRLWMLATTGGSQDEISALLGKLIKLQRDDGGWSQIESRASDAYATAHVLYAYQIAGVDPKSESVQRGVDYLLKTQAKDGSWLMISRENPPLLTHAVSAVTRKPVLIKSEPNLGTSRNAEPISFISTAWATVALSRMLP